MERSPRRVRTVLDIDAWRLHLRRMDELLYHMIMIELKSIELIACWPIYIRFFGI